MWDSYMTLNHPSKRQFLFKLPSLLSSVTKIKHNCISQIISTIKNIQRIQKNGSVLHVNSIIISSFLPLNLSCRFSYWETGKSKLPLLCYWETGIPFWFQKPIHCEHKQFIHFSIHSQQHTRNIDFNLDFL